MSHHHGHHHEIKNIKFAFFINLAFSLIEIVGGLWTNSMAIIADSLHDLGDTISLGIAWYFQRLSNKQRDRKFSYGYGRFSVLGALINSAILIVGSCFIVYETIPRLINPIEPNVQGMVLIAIVGVIANGLAVLRLRTGKTLNEQAVFFHLMEDVLGWIAVLIASIVMLFTEAPWLDPVLSLCIAAYILFNVFKTLRKSLRLFLQGMPEGTTIERIKSTIVSNKEVQGVHDIHVWTLDGTYHILTVHLEVKDTKTVKELIAMKKSIREELKKIGIEHATIEIEAQSETCGLESC